MSEPSGRASSGAASDPQPSSATSDTNIFSKIEVLFVHRAELSAEIKSLRMELDALAHQSRTPANNRAARDASYRLSQRSELLQQLVDMEAAEIARIRPFVLMQERSSVSHLLIRAKDDERTHLAQTKDYAMKGEIANARLLAQEVVRARKVLVRLYGMDASEKVKGVDMLIDDIDQRLARACTFRGDSATIREIYQYSAELSADNLRLEWCELDLRRHMKVLAQEGHIEAGRVLSKGMAKCIGARKRLKDVVEALIETADSEGVKEGIRCVHRSSIS